MNFLEAQDEVIAYTKRPDKLTDIKSQLNRAIAFFTLKANFSRDLVESSIPVDSTLYGDTVDLSTLAVPFVRFRKFKYVKPTGVRYYLNTIDPTQILTPQGIVQPNRYYVAGQSITYTLSALTAVLECGYYQYAPLLVNNADEHWMLDLMPWAVIEKAASRIFFNIGDETSAKSFEESSMDFFLVGRRDFLDQTNDAAT